MGSKPKQKPKQKAVKKARKVERSVKVPRVPWNVNPIVKVARAVAPHMRHLGGIGAILGSAISSVVGRGDYQINDMSGVTCNSLTSTSPPAFQKLKHATVVAHREYISDVYSSATAGSFGYTTYSLNPAQVATFPWLASIASNFEEYEILGMMFEFKTTSSDALNSVNTALGTVILSTQYNANNQPFITKMAQENYEFAQSCKPSQSAIHAIECARGLNPVNHLYTRSAGVPNGQDARLYDLGVFQISTTGMQGSNVNLGELWVTYQVALYKPKLPLTGTLDTDMDDYTGISAYTNTFPLSNTVSLLPNVGSTNLTSIAGQQNRLYFSTALTSGGTYLVRMVWQGGPATLAFPSISVTNGSLIQQLLVPATAAISTSMYITFLVQPNGSIAAPCYVTVGNGGTIPPGGALTISVSPWIPGLALF